MAESEKYVPSNGTEGMYFVEKFCMNCINCDPNPEGEKQCDIFRRAFCCDYKDPRYPSEWTYDEKGTPTCTAWVKWDWGNDDDENGRNEPPVIIPDEPMQLCMPFELEAMEFEIKQPQLKTTA
jgi:hypothetical protein